MFEGKEEFWLICFSISVFVDGPHGLHGLLGVEAIVVACHGKDVVEEEVEFVGV